MKNIMIVTVLIILLGSSCFAAPASEKGAQKDPSDKTTIYETIESLTGAKGKLNEKEGVFKVSVPRTDLEVEASGVKISPEMGLTAWAAFKIMEDKTMVMGDLVLLEDQVNPVMSVALNNGLQVTGLHNHFFWDYPKVMFMHIAGTGETDKLAQAVGKIFTAMKETRGGNGEKPYAKIDPAKSTLDPAKIEETLGLKGQTQNGVFKITVGSYTTMNTEKIGSDMGVNSWAAFTGSDELAVVDGDLVMREGELQSVLKALRSSGIFIVAIHNHMIFDEPRMMFLHYWGVGRSLDLANGLKLVLDKLRK